MTAVETQTN